MYPNLLSLSLSLVLMLASRGGMAQGTASVEDNAAARALVERFAGELQKELKGAMTDGGPQNAVRVCRERAPDIAARLSDESGWTVGRTSLRTRNTALNAPDDWERSVLVRFDERRAAGEEVATMSVGEIVISDGVPTFRYMQAIPTLQLCLSCHGKAINENVAAALDEGYPDDQARGYMVGDVRGAFSVAKPLESTP